MPGAVSNKQPDRDIDVDVAIDADLAADGQLVLDEHAGVGDQVLDGHVLGLAQPARLAQREREHRIAEVFQPGGGGLRRQIAGGVRPLGAVAQQHHAQQPLARLAAQHVLQGRSDGGLLSFGLLGQGDFAALGGGLVQLGVERVGFQLEIALQSGQRRCGLVQSHYRRASQRVLLPTASGTDMLRDWSASTTSVAACFLVCV